MSPTSNKLFTSSPQAGRGRIKDLKRKDHQAIEPLQGNDVPGDKEIINLILAR
jgi:hypothetical protein